MKSIKTTFAALLAVALLGLFAPEAYADGTTIDSGEILASDYVPVTIDGSYDDWADKPHSKLHYPWDAANTYHLGALFRDEDFLYLHVKMSDRSYTSFNGYNYIFNVDGAQSSVAVVPPEGTNISPSGTTRLIVRNQNNYAFIVDSAGYLSKTAGRGDEWELRIPLTFFSSDPDSIKQISFQSPNLGPQFLVATGTPTAPILIAGSGLLFAAGGYILHKKIRKTPKTKDGKEQ